MALNEITKGMSNAAEMIDGNFKKIEPMIGDTGWVDLPITNLQFEAWGNDDKPKYRRVGDLVTISGVIKNKVTIPASSSPLVMTLLPENIVPEQSFFLRQQGSLANTFLYGISSVDKGLAISRYGTDSIIEIPAGRWLSIHATYMV